MIDWSLEDDALRTALFRFVDVLPSLDSPREVSRHLSEYFDKVDHALGSLAFLAQALHAGPLVAPFVRHNVERLARRFIVEEEPAALIEVLEKMREEPAAFTLDLVGEATVSEREADAMQQRYLNLLRTLTPIASRWPEVPQIDAGSGGLARVNVSVKLSSLCARFDPLDPTTETAIRDRLRPILREASALGAALTVDMEQYARRELTLRVFESLLEESEFQAKPHVTLAFQAYLVDAEEELQKLLAWASARARRIGVRLIKGAYWDSEIAWARQENWPVPVFMHKEATDASYERLARLLLEHNDVVDAAFGSHNIRSLAHALVLARHLNVPQHRYEIQMLYGMAEPIRRALIQAGERVRIYLPVGDLIPGMSYLIRRLMENTSNTSFLRQTYADEADVERLIAAPAPVHGAGERPAAREKLAAHGPFTNEPRLDFSRASVRDRFRGALASVRSELGRSYPLWIDGKEVRTDEEIASINPARPDEVVGRVPLARNEEADRALARAERFFPEWRDQPLARRVDCLFRAAAIMREKRAMLAAWEVFEVGKRWNEADADVTEAIDFLEYYAREMQRLGESRITQPLPGEHDSYLYEPRGVAAVIAPWNFPLAILTGMTAAPLVAGNCVIVKPAEQSPVMGALLFEILRAAEVPDAACQLLQGRGDLGAYLVRHPAVRVLVFTGSREVGLEILETTAARRPGQEHIKRVVCEMGGKNAIIVDEDADLDEAVHQIIDSAFAYQGQKCSAASRLILVEDIHDRVVARLGDAVRGLRVGAPEDPANFIGPVIDAAAYDRIRDYIEVGRREGRCLVESEAPPGGFFIGPHIFTGIEPQHRLAQEEIFGPVLSVMKARDFDHALEIANGTAYGLTGGLFSRSPAHIDAVRRRFHVGNLYINRGITGSIVQRHPFGGLKLSGIGSKAGGPDYLQQFLECRTISENTLRHGFVPPDELR